jgi:hypothetical protein
MAGAADAAGTGAAVGRSTITVSATALVDRRGSRGAGLRAGTAGTAAGASCADVVPKVFSLTERVDSTTS